MSGAPNKALLKELAESLEALATRRKFFAKEYFEPYPKQLEHFGKGKGHTERLMIAGNQLGKSEAGAFEAACHATGDYPPWWNGRRWNRPVRGWCVGETSLVTRDVSQKKLMGAAGVQDAYGTGFIPKDRIVDVSLARGVTDAYDTIQVRHSSGGVSTLTFKSYEQGRQKMQGEPIDFAWCDEEPPMAIYSEILTRTTATKGMVWVTFTPLLGRSDTVNRFLDEPSPDRAVTTMTIHDALHFTDEERQAIINRYPAHEREARSMGIPIMGSGRIFPYSDESIMEEPITAVPAHWVKLWGIDFGIGHPFAAAMILWDRDNDVIHVHICVRVADQLPLQHSVPMKAQGAQVPVAWPQDGTARQSDGEPLSRHYKKNGLLMLPGHATWEDGSVSTEPGIMEMQERMTTGRFKVARHLADWWEEYRLYHRKDGQIVKVRDDLLSATRVAIMMKRYARNVPLGGTSRRIIANPIAEGVDFDVFG